MTAPLGSWTRTTVIVAGALEAVIWIGLIANDLSKSREITVGLLLFAVAIYKVQLGPTFFCVILALVLGIANRWLWIALARLLGIVGASSLDALIDEVIPAEDRRPLLQERSH